MSGTKHSIILKSHLVFLMIGRLLHTSILLLLSGADPGFPVGGGDDPLGGVPTYDFVKFSKKLYEIEKILGHRGARWGAPLNPPLTFLYQSL